MPLKPLLCIALLLLFLVSACSGGTQVSLDFQMESAPPQATFIRGGNLPYTHSDVEGATRSYAIFGCDCTFEEIVAHYVSRLGSEGYQRFGSAAEPRARFLADPPDRLVEMSLLDQRYHPASFLWPRLRTSDLDKAKEFRTAYVITLTQLPSGAPVSPQAPAASSP